MAKDSSGGGIGFLSLLFLVFLVLKLTNVISWSWWWVTAPIWGGVLLSVIIVVISVLMISKK